MSHEDRAFSFRVIGTENIDIVLFVFGCMLLILDQQHIIDIGTLIPIVIILWRLSLIAALGIPVAIVAGVMSVFNFLFTAFEGDDDE